MCFSAMMHGYLVFDKDWNLLVPFRTWQNTITGQAAGAAAAIPANLMQGLVGVVASVVLFRLLYKVPALRERFWKG